MGKENNENEDVNTNNSNNDDDDNTHTHRNDPLDPPCLQTPKNCCVKRGILRV